MKRTFYLVVFLAVITGLGGAAKVFVLDYTKLILSKEPLVVQISSDMTARDIGRLLAQKGVIPDPEIFYYNVRVRRLGPTLKAGEYQFQKRRNLQRVIMRLVQGDSLYHRFTVAEGLTSQDILDLLKKDERLTGEVTLKIPEGSLLPETYNFQRGKSRDALIRVMQESLQEAYTDLWEKRQENLPFKTWNECLTLASIVEKETAIPSERPLIAAVFVNRLRKGMALQSDPTVIYALEKKQKKPLDRRLLKGDLKIKSPYNTYLNPGLPPGPICHPGIESIKAVLNPIATKYLFFVADGSGGHVFAKTYKEHARNHAKWRKIRAKLK